MKEFLLNRKSLIKFGKWSLALISLALFTYFIFKIILVLAAHTMDATNTVINTTTSPDKLSRNGTAEGFNITIDLSAGNATSVNITVPGYNVTSRANYSVDASTVVTKTGWTVYFPENYSTPSNAPRIINVTMTTVTNEITDTVPLWVNFSATPILNETTDNSTQKWEILTAEGNTTETQALTRTMAIDSNAPRFGTTVPLDNGYIKGTTSQNFTVTVTDLNLNTNNVSVTFDKGAGTNRTLLTCVGTAGTYGCSQLLNFGGGVGGLNVIEGNVVNYFFDGSDNAGNQGSNGTASSKLSVTVDKTAPQWGNITIPGNATYSHGTSHTFNVTWNDTYLLNTVLIEHNFTGTLTNYSVTTNTSSNFSYTFSHIPTGTHQVRFYANDSVTPLDNPAQNNKTEIQWFRITQNTSTANFLHIKLNGTDDANTSFTYPSGINATGYKDIAEGRVTLYRNQCINAGNCSGLVAANVTAEGSSTNEAMNETRLGNATWNFTVYYPATQNYSEANQTFYALVNKGSVTLVLTLNGTAANRSYTYNTAVNASGNKTTTIGSEYNLTLLRNGVLVNTTLTGDLIFEHVVLGNATYNYTLVFNGSTNYTDASISDNRFVLVNKGDTLVVLYLNETLNANLTVATGATVNITGTVNNSQGNISLWRDNVLYNSSTTLTQIENISTYSGAPATAFNITVGYAQTENFTANLSTFYIVIESTKSRETRIATSNITNNTVIGKYGNGTILINATWIDNFQLDSFWLSSNETGSFVNNSGWKFVITGASNVNNSNATINPTGADFGIGEVIRALVYVNDTSNNQNQTATFQWTIDGTAPVLSTPTPSNFTFINGSTTELFSVNVQDDTLNASNVTLHWRPRGASYTRISLNCNINSGTTYICNNTIDLSAETDGTVIEYFFNASDLSQLTATLPANPAAGAFNVTIDRNAPQFTNHQANVSTVCRYCGVNVSARWTDNHNLSYAILETNETGAALNKSAYGSVFAFPTSSTYTVNFNWTNSSVAPGAFIITRIFVNDTLGKQNVTGYVNFTIDGTIPIAQTETVNTTNATTIERGATINLTSTWTDGLQLDKWWSYVNGTGSFVNSTAVGFTTGNVSMAYVNTSTFTKGGRFELRIYANDTSNNQNSTQLYQWVIDNNASQYANSNVNTSDSSTIRRGAAILISANWSEDVRLFGWWVNHNATSDGLFTNTSVNTTFGTSNYTNYTLETTSAVRGAIIQARIFTNDTSDNRNSTQTFQWTVDGTSPQFGNITTNPTSAVTYSPGVNYTFNVTWTDNLAVSKVLFEWNASTNYTDGTTGSLGAGVVSSGSDVNNYSISLYDLSVSTGNYTYRWLANDTSDNWNNTATQTYNITANSTNPITLKLNGTENTNLTVAYGAFALPNVTHVIDKSGTINLYRNGTLATSTENNTAIRLGFGDHRYFANSTGNVNYSANTTGITLIVFVQQGNITVNLALNGTEANSSFTYPSAVNATGWRNASVNNEGNLSLYRDGVIVATLADSGTISVTENVILGNASHNYTLIFTATNYSTSTIVNRYSLVNKGSISLNLTLNGTNANNSYTYPAAVNATAWKNGTHSQSAYNISLYRDGVIVATSLSLDALSENIRLANATYNYTVVFNGSTNYTDTSITTDRFALVNKGPITIALNQATQTITFGTSLTQYCTSNDVDFRCSLWRNTTAGDSNVTSTENNTAITHAAGGVIYRANVTAPTANYSWTEQTATITINKGSILLNLTLNGTNGNNTYAYPAAVNATAFKNATNSQSTFNISLYRNGTLVATSTSADAISENIRLGNATYNYTVVFESTNYTNTSVTDRFAFVNKGPITITLNESTQTIVYGASLTQYCTSNDVDFRCSLWRNSTAGDSNVTTAENNTAITWGGGGVIYRANVTAPTANYTWTEQTSTFTINTGSSNITLLLNNNATNITIEQGVAANFTATINTSYSVTFNLTVNITSWGTKGNTSASLQNTTSTGSVTAARYNVTAFFNGDQNFSSTSTSLYINITADSTGPTIKLFNYNNGTASRSGASLTLNVSVTDSGVGQTGTVNVTIGSLFAGLLNRSGTTEWYNGTVTISTSVSDGNQTIILNISDTLANVGTNSSFVVTIDSTAPVITITLPNNNTYGRINASTFVWINGTVSDNIAMGSGNVSANNTNFAVFNFTGSNNTNFNVRNSSAVSDGKIAVRINYSDNAGNVQNITVEWFVDNTPPSTVIAETNSSTQFYPANSSLTIRVRVDDAQQTNGTITLKYYINGSWQAVAMTGTPGTSTSYSVAISTLGDDYRVDADGRSYVPFYVEGVDNATNNLANINGSANAPLANITLGSTGTIDGYIFLTNRSIIPNNTASLTVSDGTRSSTVNTAGYYRITAVPAGTYTVTVAGTGYRSNQTTSVVVTEGTTTQVNMSVTGPENFNITLPGTAGTSTTGFWDGGWHQFNFRTGVFSAGTTNYTVENLFLTVGVTSSYNYTAVWRYNATSTTWSSFIPKASGNTLVNISSSDDSYWTFMNATDRVEMESRYT